MVMLLIIVGAIGILLFPLLANFFSGISLLGCMIIKGALNVIGILFSTGILFLIIALLFKYLLWR